MKTRRKTSWREVEAKLSSRRRIPRRVLKAVASVVRDVAYEILDKVVSPAVGIKGVWADTTMADMSLYLDRDSRSKAMTQRRKIVEGIARRFGAQEYAVASAFDQPLDVVALVAISGGRRVAYGDGKKREFTAEDAWRLLVGRESSIRHPHVLRAKVVLVAPDRVVLTWRGREVVVLASDVPWGGEVTPAEYASVGESFDVTVLRVEHDEKGSPSFFGWLPWPKVILAPKKSRRAVIRRARKRAEERRKAR